jgi:hypothetical protein
VTIRFYVLPMEPIPPSGFRHPKYFAYDPLGVTGITANYSLKDYGLVDFCVIVTDISAADHTTLSSNADVLAPPVNIDTTMTQGAVNSAKTFLEGFNIPADWVNAGVTYRSVIRTVTGIFLFMQRVTAILGHGINFANVSLSAQWQNFPADIQAALLQAATEFGYSTAQLTGTTTLRAILKFMADAWGATPILFGLATL